jgi:anaerobic ribonucleoside-triphosphate reductase activating protein
VAPTGFPAVFDTAVDTVRARMRGADTNSPNPGEEGWS